ncbi:ABC transporter permease [Halobacteria archaeon AArc-dxtr1]|nr:ABC transporter permease [Halobacteria archaeon AArc-dxtr1]
MSRLAALSLFVREDIRDTRRERQLQIFVGLYVLLSLFMTYTAGRSAGSDEATVAEPLLPLFTMFTVLLTLGFFAPAVVERRASGALKVVLGLPVSRGTVVFGTFLGRSIVICGALFAAFLAAVPVALVQGVPLDPVGFVGALLLLSLLGVTFTALSIGLSAISRTTTRATAGAMGLFLLFYFQLWTAVPQALLYARHGFSMPDASPEWVTFVEALNPVAAYTHLVSGLFEDVSPGTLVQPPAEPAFYERPGFALGILLGWIVVSVGLGYHRFRSADL